MSLATELGLDQPFEDRRHEALLSIMLTADVLSTAGNRLLRPEGLTEAQFNLMLALKYTGRPLTQSDLGKRLVVTRASVTSLLDRLEAKGLVTREAVPGNRRAYHVALTAPGYALVDRVEPRYRDLIHQVLDGFDDRACRELVRLHARVRRGVAALGQRRGGRGE